MGRVRTPAMLLEMCLIKLCTPSLDTDDKTLTARIEKLEQAVANGIPIAQAPAQVQAAQAPVNMQKAPIEDLPDTNDLTGYKPLDIWTDVIENLPDNIKFGFTRSNALIKDNFVLIRGSALAVEMAIKENRELIETELSKAIGRKIRLISSPDSVITEEKEEKEDKVKQFLDLAESLGINIKRQ
jgi:hypothetical protein